MALLYKDRHCAVIRHVLVMPFMLVIVLVMQDLPCNMRLGILNSMSRIKYCYDYIGQHHVLN